MPTGLLGLPLCSGICQCPAEDRRPSERQADTLPPFHKPPAASLAQLLSLLPDVCYHYTLPAIAVRCLLSPHSACRCCPQSSITIRYPAEDRRPSERQADTLLLFHKEHSDLAAQPLSSLCAICHRHTLLVVAARCLLLPHPACRHWRCLSSRLRSDFYHVFAAHRPYS